VNVSAVTINGLHKDGEMTLVHVPSRQGSMLNFCKARCSPIIGVYCQGTKMDKPAT